MLALFNREDATPTQVVLHANRNLQLLRECLRLVIGDKIALVEGMTGMNALQNFIIHEKQLLYEGGHLVTATFTLAHANPFVPVTCVPARLNVMRLGTSRLNGCLG
jgi:hypothetical protein